MDAPDRWPWTAFLGGRWVKTPPVRPGRYFIADRSGTVRGTRDYLTDRQGRVVQVGLGFAQPGWQGWWWSMPVPDAPSEPVPEWTT